MINFSLLTGCVRNLWKNDGRGAYEECNANSEGYRGPQVALDPFFKISGQVLKKNGDMSLIFNGTADLPNIVSERSVRDEGRDVPCS